MNDDYLWDKSGEPDPQIQQLEEILGSLRYRPTPLNLPKRRNYFPVLAIAATVVFALIAAGLWLDIRSREASIPPVAIALPEAPKPILQESEVSQSPPKRKLVRRRQSQEALAAKEQVILALRLASEKLNLAHRRTQTPAQIRNQHRAG